MRCPTKWMGMPAEPQPLKSHHPRYGELAEYSQHPGSTSGTSRYQYQLFRTTADSCQPPTCRAHLPAHGEVMGKHHCCQEGAVLPSGLSPLTQAPIPSTHNQQTTCCPATFILAKPWVNKLRVTPSDWGYSQILARLIITPGSLPATVGEARVKEEELLSGPCHTKMGSVPADDLPAQFQEIFKEHPSQQEKNTFSQP